MKIGELKKLIEGLPDDIPVVGYSGDDCVDYTAVSFYIHDRTEDDEWDEQKQSADMKVWWGDEEIPDKVFVCNTD